MPAKRKVNGVTRQLARPGDPLVMANGRIIQPEGSAIDVESKVTKLSSKTFRASKRRTIKELPAIPGMVNAISCVLFYTMLGVGDREISEALKITTDDLKNIRKSPAYEECFQLIAEEFVSANSNLISARIAAYSHDALTSVADVAFNGKKEEVRLRASTDLLDRAGHAPREFNRKAMAGLSSLKIMITEGVGKSTGVEISVDGDGHGNSP